MGVLRGNDEERLFESVRLTVDGHLPLVHCFEERALRLGRRSVDLVGEQNLREDRTGSKLEGALGLIEHVAAEDIGRHQIRSALKASKHHAHRRRQGARQGRLADTGNVLEQQMSSCQKRDHRQFDDFLLAPNHQRDVLNEAPR